MKTDNVNHPQHYKGYTAEIECIDITRRLNFQLGNAFKYIWRAGLKGDKSQELEDYKKALWYVKDYEVYEDLQYRDGKENKAMALAIWDLIEDKIPEEKRGILFCILNADTEVWNAEEQIVDKIEALQKLPEEQK